MESLVALASLCGAVDGLEIGCNSGRTSRLLLENVPTMRWMVGIDVPPGYAFEKAVQRNEVPTEPGKFGLQHRGFELRMHREGSLAFSGDDFPQGFDFIFIDGDHSRRAVEHDSELARSIIRKGGIICWHDYHERGNVDVKAVVDAQRAAGHDIRLVDGTWIAFERF